MSDNEIRTKLTSAELDAFGKTGYHIHGRLFTDSEIADLKQACVDVCDNAIYETGTLPDERYWNPGDDPVAMHKIDNCWKANNTIRNIVTSPRLGEIAAQLLGEPQILLWHDQLSWKPANGGKVATWHQDWSYWQMIAECKTISCWIALDDARPNSGPMIYLKGSHKFGLIPHPETISGDDELRPNMPGLERYEEVPVIVPAGYVAFHHGLTLHGSGINNSPYNRGALVSHVMAGSCTYRERNEHRCEFAMREYSEYPKTGERFHGPQFPQLWPAI
jgi:ectoine hydroxylase-related dioxygenase (phytanoyl-CoA dioxygenase family)